MNDLYFTVKNKKGLQGQKLSLLSSIFAVKPMKKGKTPLFWQYKTHNTDIFVSILWFLYGGERWIQPHPTIVGTPWLTFARQRKPII